jgi:hypothetical protein
MKAFALIFTLMVSVSPSWAAETCADLFMFQATDSQNHLLQSTRIHHAIAREIQDYEAYAMSEYGQKAYEDAYANVPHNVNQDASISHFIPELRALGPDFQQLIVDPGLLQYFSEFKLFMRTHKGLSAWEARDLFARQPWMQTKVYRGMALTDSQADHIKKIGIQSSFARSSPNQIEDVKKYGRGRLGAIGEHQHDGAGTSPFISVTSYLEIAAGAAQAFSSPTLRREITFMRSRSRRSI